MLDFECPHCKEILQIPDKFIGTKGKCRKCGSMIVPSVPVPSFTKPTSGNAKVQYGDYRAPNLVILHVETTGPSSRKCDMIELGCLKVDLSGKEIDTYWTFCNPDQHIPPKIQARTGISEDMLAQAPYSFEVSKDWFDWIGPNAVIVADHAHFHAKFLSAPLLREDVEPPVAHIIDIAKWAEALKLNAPDYKLRTLLHAVGAPLEQGHYRALETCNGMRILLEHMLEKQAVKVQGLEQKSLLGKMLRKDDGTQHKKLYDSLVSASQPFSEASGNDFYDRKAFEARRLGVSVESLMNTGGDGHEPAFVLHMPEWFEEKRHMIKRYRSQPRTDADPLEDHSGDAQWEFALIEASQSETAEEKRRFLMRAVDLRAGDPKPYEQMIGFYIKEKNYQSAHDVCERYFDSENWKQPQHASTSLKMLERLQKLEMKLAKHY